MESNGNGKAPVQVEADQRPKRGRNATSFTSETGRAAVQERERKRMERIGETRERLELHALRAADTLIDVMQSHDPTERRLAATAILDRVLGKPDQRVEVHEVPEAEARLDEWLRELTRNSTTP